MTRVEQMGRSSRRAFLKAGAGGAAVLGAYANLASAQSSGGSFKKGGSGFPIDPILFLVNRITPGFSVTTYNKAKRLGYHGFLEQQLDFESIDNSGNENRVLDRYRSLSMTAKQILDTYFDPFEAGQELKEATLLRNFGSPRFLFERMTTFWTDHFNILHSEFNLILKTIDDRAVIRDHALGAFPDMLRASAHSGAMMVYLNNDLNVAGTPNENYARELMELHTLGVHGGYTPQDIRELARCLTGWTIHANRANANWGDFKFSGGAHDQDAKTFLGHDFPPDGGESDGDRVLDILSTHPKTAEYISEKMARWLLSYEPPKRLVHHVARIYLNTGGSIKDMIRAILQPENIMVHGWGTPKMRRPFHYIVSLLSALKARIGQPHRVIEEMVGIGQQPFGWGPPTGYPDSMRVWGTTVLPRWNFAHRALNDEIPGVNIDLTKVVKLMGDPPKSELAQGVNRLLTGGVMRPEDIDLVQNYVDSRPFVNEKLIRQALTLAASSPSFQLY